MTATGEMPQPAFRDARPADAAVIAELGRRSFTETFGHLYRPEDLATFLLNHNEQDWRTQLESPDFAIRIAEFAGEVIAYTKLGPPSLPFETDKAAIELRQFYVLAPWQGAGIAATMMDWTLQEARRRGAKEVSLSVFVDNHRARRFYERYGFAFVRAYPFLVGDHADEDHILRLTLDE